ncbi:MAG: hypothetical protein M1834_001482 [Cirrosporium novae-zelandiae]|nr:MAG: hypothetical protein M1834_008612 [Cirrosporium novae-zelandiae]KAI9736016.1 MAG: hypothetical protein M1834_001482 [Cirrosporium novae-zelandiae]
MASSKKSSSNDLEKNPPLNPTVQVESGEVICDMDESIDRSYLRKLDLYLLPYLSIMYFFNSVDRSNLGNAKTDGMDTDLGFTGNEYSLLLLLFYIPNGLCDLPLNMLTKSFSGRIVLPTLMTAWGSIALLQCAATNFAGMLVLRLIMGALEAGFFAGVVFYLTLFYTRGELGFRISLFFGSALVASAFSGLISYGVFQIDNPRIEGWKWLFIIEGALTVFFGAGAFFWLPASPETAWFLQPHEKKAAHVRMLRDGTSKVGTEFSFRESFQGWNTPRFGLWCLIAFTYPIAFSTTANFLPQIVGRLGYSTVKTNLWTVAPNCVGFVVLVCVCFSSDKLRERTFHIVLSLIISLIGMIILCAINVLAHKSVAYFACFMMAAGAYIPSCLVHSWHNNNNLNESSRAAWTGLLVGLGNLGGILSTATFRTEYAPSYIPTLIATSCCNAVCIISVLIMGIWMKSENRKRNKEQGVSIKAEDIDTSILVGGEKDAHWRYFT